MATNTLAVPFLHFPEAYPWVIEYDPANQLAIWCYGSAESRRGACDAFRCKQAPNRSPLERPSRRSASITSGRIARCKPPISAAFVAEFQRLCEARDLAAYRVVGCLEGAIYACRLGKASVALTILHRAKSSFEIADRDLETFGVRNGFGAVNGSGA